jgi:hypothetical protein
MKKHMKHKDGKYHIDGMIFEVLIGSRAQVMNGTAYKTSGNLKKKHLKYNKHGRIVSRAKSAKGPQMLKRLTSKGYFTRKGKFGFVRKDGKKSHKTRKAKGSRKGKGSRGHRSVHPIKGVSWEDRATATGRFAKKPSYRRKKGGKRSRSRRRR